MQSELDDEDPMLCFIAFSSFLERDSSELSISSSLEAESGSCGTCGELKSLGNKVLLAEITEDLLSNGASFES